jgi:hypothetical protein
MVPVVVSRINSKRRFLCDDFKFIRDGPFSIAGIESGYLAAFQALGNTKIKTRTGPAQNAGPVQGKIHILSAVPYSQSFLWYQGEGGQADPDPWIRICISSF